MRQHLRYPPGHEVAVRISRTAHAATPAAVSTSIAETNPQNVEPAAARPESVPNGNPVAVAEPPASTATPQGRSAKRAAAPSAALVPATPVAIADTDGIWLADGTRMPWPSEPIRHAGQVAELAYQLDLGYRLSPKFVEPGQVWVTDQLARHWGIELDDNWRGEQVAEATASLPFVTDAAAAGWNLGDDTDDQVPGLHVWTQLRRAADIDDAELAADHPRKRGMWLVLMTGLGRGASAALPILRDDPAPALLAERLTRLAGLLGCSFRISAGVTSIAVMKQAMPHSKTFTRSEVFAPLKTPLPYGVRDVEREFDWSRPVREEERTHRFVHCYDRTGSHPSAVAGLELPIGEPTDFPNGLAFDPTLPGLWKIVPPTETNAWLYPSLLNPGGLAFSESKWVATPTLARAIKLGYTPEITEATVWQQHSRQPMRGWQERFRDINNALDPTDREQKLLRDTAKLVRNKGLGLMGSATYQKNKEGYHPARVLMIASAARANIIYRIEQIGVLTDRWPVAINKDSIVYTSDDPDPVTAWPGADPSIKDAHRRIPLGTGFGQYKPECSGLLATQLPFLTGNGWDNARDADGRRVSPKQKLTPVEDWNPAEHDSGATS